MKKLLMLILLLPALANAEHHRVHAIAFADQADVNIGQLLKHMTYYANNPACVFTDEQQANNDVIFLYAGRIRDTLDSTRAMLADPTADLDTVRRLVNDPGRGPNLNAPISMLKRISGMTHRARMNLTACPDANNNLRSVFQRLALTWVSIDHMAWHVTDAIREEVYLDTSFGE